MILFACQKEEVVNGESIESRTPPEKVTVCHLNENGEYEVREVPVPSLNGHLSHGDFLPDADGDGYSAITACTGSKDDCNDADASVHPGADEVCNGVDDNCNGLVDNADPEFEGFGGPEICNGLDDNCDGIIDNFPEDGTWYFRDDDLDGHGSSHEGNKLCVQPPGWVTNTGDCNDEDPTIHNDALDIPDDGIDQDCSGGDSTTLVCECFSMQDLQDLYNYTPWPFGWWSDVPGCKAPPYDQLLELWITNVGQPAQNFNFSAQAGTINGNWFASSAKFNHLTGQFDILCGGYTSQAVAEPCRQILSNFIQQLRSTHPDWDYCVRFP